MLHCKHAGLPEPGLSAHILSVVLSTIYSVSWPFGVTVKWTDPLTCTRFQGHKIP